MTPKFDFTSAEKRFATTMRQYARMSSKSASEVVNKKSLDVVIKTIVLTPKSNKSVIREKLKSDGLVYRLLNKTGLKRKQILIKAGRLIRARVSSSTYIKVGWYKAVQAFGGRGGKIREGKSAAMGSGTKATTGNPTAVVINRSIGATKVSGPALRRALELSAEDMMVYIQKKLASGWKNGGR